MRSSLVVAFENLFTGGELSVGTMAGQFKKGRDADEADVREVLEKGEVIELIEYDTELWKKVSDFVEWQFKQLIKKKDFLEGMGISEKKFGVIEAIFAGIPRENKFGVERELANIPFVVIQDSPFIVGEQLKKNPRHFVFGSSLTEPVEVRRGSFSEIRIRKILTGDGHYFKDVEIKSYEGTLPAGTALVTTGFINDPNISERAKVILIAREIFYGFFEQEEVENLERFLFLGDEPWFNLMQGARQEGEPHVCQARK